MTKDVVQRTEEGLLGSEDAKRESVEWEDKREKNKKAEVYSGEEES